MPPNRGLQIPGWSPWPHPPPPQTETGGGAGIAGLALACDSSSLPREGEPELQGWPRSVSRPSEQRDLWQGPVPRAEKAGLAAVREEGAHSRDLWTDCQRAPELSKLTKAHTLRRYTRQVAATSK